MPTSNHARQSDDSKELERGLGLLPATALNMIDMVGIGPFIVGPLVIQAMGGPQALLAWAAGAVLAALDGCVWAELGTAMPKAGGSYVFLREAYGPARWGKLLSFLFIWQTLIQAPLVIASGAIGFSEYFTFLTPLGTVGQKCVSAALVLALIGLLYRRITEIGKISVLLWIGVIATMAWIIFGGLTHFHSELAFTYPAGAWNLSWVFFAGLGAGMVQTIYAYLGYYNICNLGSEIRDPEKNIPRGIFLSIAGIAVLYLAMQTSILGVVPWREAAGSKFVVSEFMQRIYGSRAAQGATIMILWVAFASMFSTLLGYSRVPYAAARDGNFFRIFARVHPSKSFPYVSLLVLGGAAFLFSLLFRLRDVISAILAMRLLVQFVGQAIGLMLLHRRWPAGRLPFKMWLYPVPVLVSICGWVALFLSTGRKFALGGLLVISAGVIVYLTQAFIRSEWPFAEERAEVEL
ncbi:MAG TPA: amino acid permease [Candidatus Acidoferrales bacterium]|nr:amino acid permease [Candidatus Acidoferrales bacterium]